MVESAPGAYAEGAWAALLSRPGGAGEDILRYIVEWAPAYSDKVRAEMVRREAAK